METIRLSEKKRNSLQYLELSNSINNTESDLYPINLGKNWKKEPKLLKEFKPISKVYLSNKLTTLNNLIEFKTELSSIEELVLPEKIAFIEKKDKVNGGINESLGYIMPYIKNNINLSLILHHNDIEISEKIKYLKMVGNIIKRTLKLQILHEGFYLGDIHEGNFILDFDKEMLRVVDIDSSKIAGSYPFSSKYLQINRVIKNEKFSKKYPKNYKGDYIPNENTEWLCFITMILNTISNGKITNLRYNEFYDYLSFLNDNGFSYELLDKFSAIYQGYDNENPTSYLDLVPNDVSKVNLDDFIRRERKRF